ncbi:MAG: hypothetical protein A2086_03070 [Spirochaetes bacterium GWD1_27_9]|nr:MAG: hypothetical protein A2086_03070 [Spirochaetes bacterium GWD1_27_9]
MKTIVLAEKPSVGRELARVLGCKPVGKSYFEGNNYIVTWAMGHLVELADPGDYNDDWKKWQMDTLPMLPERMRLQVIKKTSFQFNAIKSLFQRKDVDNLVIATDAGREGELVARWIIRLCGYKGNFQRLWISSQTDKAIKDGFASLKPGQNYDNLLYAAECRAEADWIIGLNVTRALSCKYDARLSAGRVQTPTLAMIVDRENEIKSFKPEPYWTITADFGVFKGEWQSQNGVNRFKEQSNAIKIADKVKDGNGVISNVSIKDVAEQPPLAYDLTALQRDANHIMSFSAKKTLQVLQSLYEHHKIVTYPRTDSRHITTDMVPTLKDRLRGIENTKYESIVKKLLASDVNPGKILVDNSKVSDHHAIIPTEEKVRFDRLSPDEKALWDLIAKRFLVVLSTPYKYKSIAITTVVNNETFVTKGREIIEKGWKLIDSGNYKEDNDEDDVILQNLSKYKTGDKVTVNKVNVIQGLTKPPPRYTEGTLLAAMESPGKFIESKELKDSIQKGGLGTPATRADIIEKLFSHYYIERNGKELVPTPQGIELIDIVPEQLRSPELTARWELRLSKISQGTEKNFVFTKDIRENAKQLVNLVKNATDLYTPSNESNRNCPFCGKKLLFVRDKKGKKILVCRSLTCGYEEDENRNDELTRKPSQKEKEITRKLINKYTSNNSSDSFTLGDLLKKSMEEKKK